MKNIWFAIGAITLLCIAIVCNLLYLKDFVHETMEYLDQTVQLAKQEEFQKASETFDKAKDRFDKSESYFSIILMHEEIDEIEQTISSAEEFLQAGEMPQFFSEISQLNFLIEHIYRLEELSWDNIF